MSEAEDDAEPSRLVAALGLLLALSALYWVVAIVAPQIYRPGFLLVSLAIVFIHVPSGPGLGTRPRPADWLLVALTALALGWPMVDAASFWVRAATPSSVDLVLGATLILLVLEATRRTVGWALVLTVAAFLAYAFVGPWLDRVGLSLIAHRGYSIERVIGTLYLTFEGIMGVPLDVAATYIVLFTIFGAVVEKSGAGRFFVEWALALVGRSGGAGAGRAVTLAGYLLGAVSGSGVANTVMLGAVAWPMMRTAGYPPDVGAAVLASAGLGAILAPPVMGAAAFLIAEYLQVLYATVVTMAIVPAVLYYLAIVVTVEAESRRLGLIGGLVTTASIGSLTRRGWPYFASLAFMTSGIVSGMTTFRAVFWATAVAAAVSVIDRSAMLTPRRLASALAAGGISVVPVVATTAAAGVIVGVVVLTGLGLKAATLIVTLAGGHVVLTSLYAAVAVWVLGLALPVTACYIIAAVMVAPALTEVGITLPAAHMFVFYYAVLSEVSPPTALSPLAAAAVTRANPFRTTMLTWKYTLPAFLVPLTFAIGAHGRALLLQANVGEILWVSCAAALGVVAIALATSGFWRRPLTATERAVAATAGLLLLTAEPRACTLGAGLAGTAIVWLQRRPIG